MTKKLNIAVLCGGQSTEHEVSINSARNVVAALDKEKYHVNVIYITHHGSWFLIQNPSLFLQEDPQQLMSHHRCEPMALIMGSKRPFALQCDLHRRVPIDCVFPVLHGTHGEDGGPQGLLELANMAYVGADILGSAICMDKPTSKQILRAANLPTADWITLKQEDIKDYPYAKAQELLGSVFFIKPASLGSSVGITKVKSAADYDAAVQEAFHYDTRIIMEPFVAGREIECSVLGNDNPVASLPGEIVTSAAHEFYSYSAKYLDPDGAAVITPADLPPSIVDKVQELSKRAFQALGCAGMARIDFFVDGEKIIINEVNTIPGFTNISMYPKNWIVSGIAYAELLDHLIQLAMARHQHKQSLNRVFNLEAPGQKNIVRE